MTSYIITQFTILNINFHIVYLSTQISCEDGRQAIGIYVLSFVTIIFLKFYTFSYTSMMTQTYIFLMICVLWLPLCDALLVHISPKKETFMVSHWHSYPTFVKYPIATKYLTLIVYAVGCTL